MKGINLCRIGAIALCFLLLQFLYGCDLCDAIITQNLVQQSTKGATIIEYFENNEDSFFRCITEINNILETEKGTIYRIRLFDESRLQITKLSPICANAKSYYNNQVLYEFLSSSPITMIEVKERSVSFHCDFASVSKGIAFVPSNRLEDIDGYYEDMSFTTYENGYLGIQEGTDNSFFYSWLKDQWCYFEVQY